MDSTEGVDFTVAMDFTEDVGFTEGMGFTDGTGFAEGTGEVGPGGGGALRPGHITGAPGVTPTITLTMVTRTTPTIVILTIRVRGMRKSNRLRQPNRLLRRGRTATESV
jgi:hypothetical protein